MMNNKMQWAILLIITALSLLSPALSFATYWFTHNWLALVPSASTIPLGSAWIWMIKRIFPLNQQDHERELARITRSKKRTNGG
jgi:hypothetical protein